MSESTSAAGARPIEEMSYGEVSAELEGIIKELESNQLELEDMLVRYERGVALLVAQRRRLSDAQQRVVALMGEIEDADDEVRDTTLS